MKTDTNPNKSTAKGHPLTRDEVPEECLSAYVFESQYTEFIQKRRKYVMTIERRCLDCGVVERVPVNIVRMSIRRNTLRGICKKCACRIKQTMRKGKESPLWKGGRRTTPKGYILIRCPSHPAAQNGYVQEHRLVMEKIMGRLLLPSETVHHKNGIKDDNRPENLEIWSKSHGNGGRYEDLSINQLEELIVYLKELIVAKKGQAT